MSGAADYYATPGVMTNLSDTPSGALVGLPSGAAALAAVVQGLVMHPFWVQAYGVTVPPGRESELQTRSASGMVERILELDGRPLVERRAPERRVLGNCRHFATLTTALLRRDGVPARARCGFSGYFEPGRWVDHWIVEHWDGARWVALDPQIDALQRQATGLQDDPTDLPPGRFLPAGEAWRRCQAGEADGDRFGILDLWGQWFIPGNVARDLAALNKVEMLPWDGWGDLASGAPVEDARVDEVATLTTSGDHEAIRRRYESDAGLRVPPRVSVFSATGISEVDVPELATAP